MELGDYLAVLSRQLVVIVAVTLLGAGAAAAWTSSRPPVYEATASVLVRAITTNAAPGPPAATARPPRPG